MKKIKFTILLLFSFWWSFNLYFNFPNTSLPILYTYSSYQKWDNIFFQRWNFFAPPPDSNTRLYYAFHNINNSNDIFIYEVFEKLNKNKNEKYLFNDYLINLDYTLHNLSSPIGDFLRETYDIYKYQGLCDTIRNDDKCYQLFIKKAKAKIYQLPQIKTLLKHSQIIATKQNLSNYKIQIIMGTQDLPKFHERYSDSINQKENIFFSSDFYNLKTKSWEKLLD